MFALAALADFRREPSKENEIEARELLDDLIWMSLKGFKGACWGYNFDWQSRSFFLPRGTPTIVPTAFAARALCEAAEVISRDEYLPFARTICDFILNDLNRSEETSDEVCFSYSPLDQTRVFNASLLAGEVLATVGGQLGEQSLIDWAMKAALYVVRRQRADGSWAYGEDSHQGWADNFHTAYILTSLSRIMDAGAEPLAVASGSSQPSGKPSSDFDNSLRRGYDFWTERFFLANGWPKYFPDHLISRGHSFCCIRDCCAGRTPRSHPQHSAACREDRELGDRESSQPARLLSSSKSSLLQSAHSVYALVRKRG